MFDDVHQQLHPKSENRVDQLKNLQAEKEEHQLPRPPAEVHRGQRDQRLRDSLHGHILTFRWRTRPLPLVALEYKL